MDQQHASIQFTYLGSGGWLIAWRGRRVLTAPFFTNPGLFRTAFGTIETDPKLVDRFLPPVDDVESILAGHSHYDHLLDISYIATKHAPRATIYGNDTMVNLLAATLPGSRRVSLQSKAGDHQRPGEWTSLAGGAMRVMALRSEHAPHFFGIKLYCGDVLEPQSELPTKATRWKEGQTLAFLIDLLNEDGSIAFRLHYQDSASRPPFGFPPHTGGTIDRPVDLAILCVASFSQTSGYPESAIERLDPQHLLLGHWEDFFRPRTLPIRSVPLSSVTTFIRRMKAVMPPSAGWNLPQPGQSFVFERRRDSSSLWHLLDDGPGSL